MARPRRRRILIASLLTGCPTSAPGAEEEPATDDDGVAIAPEVAGESAAKRTRSRRALDGFPEEILVWEIFVRLPAMDILRCRAVCRSWRGLASGANFLLAHHRRQPSLPLVTVSKGTEAGLPVLDRGRSRSVLGFDDYFSFKLHASCDDLLVLSRSDGRFNICNPATRQCAPLPGLTAAAGDINIVALYLDGLSGEYHVLYWKEEHFNGRYHVEETHYYVLTVEWRGWPRYIGVPSDNLEMKKAMLAGDQMDTTDLAPPVMFGSCLHWVPGWFRCDGIVVFDTVVESFRTMSLPAGATSFCNRLCDMEGSIGFSCLDDMIGAVRIWVLEDYEREVWSFKYHVEFHIQKLCHLRNMQHIILSNKGDVLVYSWSYMYHCDNTGKLLEEFQWEPGSYGLDFVGHMFKESLVKHDFFSRRGAAWGVGQPDYFERL
ncbi:putative F-box protein At1g50870 [Triticum dicoccoides]|uniref:putative F-box protein At1g50870 n=1 Tax=Triticum dicoccoides TaxID=85692 RepID=UPI00188DEE65|nr:putative F-box protein At1g50870 [Triticum dicoccoides]